MIIIKFVMINYSASIGTWPWPMEEYAVSDSNHGICYYSACEIDQALIKCLVITSPVAIYFSEVMR